MSKPCPNGAPHRHPASVTEEVHWYLRSVVVALHLIYRGRKS